MPRGREAEGPKGRGAGWPGMRSRTRTASAWLRAGALAQSHTRAAALRDAASPTHIAWHWGPMGWPSSSSPPCS